MNEILLENVNVQKNGIVYVGGLGLNSTSIKEEDRKLDYLMTKLILNCLPVRINAIHHVVRSRMVGYVVPFLLYILGPYLRARYKLHIYSNSIFDELEQFGITRTILPRDFGGESTFNYQESLEIRRNLRS
jgi:hypothetical protein